MIEPEKIHYTTKTYTAGAFGLLLWLLVVLFAVTMSLVLSAAVLAQQSDHSEAQAGDNAIRSVSREIARNQPDTMPSTDATAIRPFRVNVPHNLCFEHYSMTD